MSNSNTSPQGQSKATLPKQQSYESLLRWHTSVCEEVYKKGRLGWYVLVDTNAGSGYNKEVQCDGSPIVALNVLTSASFPWSAFFVEQSKDSCIELAQRCMNACSKKVVILVNTASRWNDKDFRYCNQINAEIVYVTVASLGSYVNRYVYQDDCSLIVNFDNQIVLSRFDLRDSTYGLVYADPNGVKDSCEQALKTFYGNGKARFVDFLINLDGQARKRVECGEKKAYDENGRTWNKDNPDEFKYNNIEALMKNVGKKYWWVRETTPGNAPGSQWTFFFGSNYRNFKFKKLTASGLSIHNIDTDKGKEVLAQLKGDKFPVSQDEQQLSLQIIL